MPATPKSKSNKLAKSFAKFCDDPSLAVMIVDADGYIIGVSAAAKYVYGWPLEDILEQHFSKFFPDKTDLGNLSKKIWDTVTTVGAWEGAVMNKNDKGKCIPILVRVKRGDFLVEGYTIFQARRFPVGTPFNLPPKQAEIFWQLGQWRDVKAIASDLKKKETTIHTQLRHIWKKVAEKDKPYSLSEIRKMAIDCCKTGWDVEMEIHSQLIAFYLRKDAFKQAK